MKPDPNHVHQRESIPPFPLVSHPTSRVLRERFARAILTCNRSELRQRVSLKESQNLAITDDLTGLYSRRGFVALASQQLKLARRNHQCALLFFADVDGLKQINDRLGHSEGDMAIMRVGRILRHTFRDSDIIARLGGEEFGILANDASGVRQKNIWSRLEEILKAEGSGNPRYSLSLSIGVARFEPWSTINLAELLDYADQAMYQAKQSSVNGRFTQILEKHIVSKTKPDEATAGNRTRPRNTRRAGMVRLASKFSSQARVTLLLANILGRIRFEPGAYLCSPSLPSQHGIAGPVNK